ncbi:MAG: alpha-hydroxy-acid oxidizing protein [Acidobacteria bacterium]|nr:alpha-hydroxy-acid oxidizing protein [Acidobacteriota bacterium]
MAGADSRWKVRADRRAAIRSFAAALAGSPLLRGQLDPFRDHSRVPRLDELRTPLDFEPVAFAKLTRYNYDYTAYGSDGEFTMRRNREAFDWVRLLPGVVTSGTVNTATEILGIKMEYPILISPTAAQVQLHPDGEIAMHQAAAAASNTPMILSTNTSIPVDKVVPAAPSPMWFQLYAREDMESNRELLDRAQEAGCKAIVVTIDQQAPMYERAQHDRNLLGSPVVRRASTRQTAANPYRIQETRMFYNWGMFAQLRAMIKVPMVIKGVISAEDAKLAVEHGLDAVYVSNHGGRGLDYSPSTLEVLPEIAEAVGGRVPILFDSGIRRGTDILKALALGASAVCLGRMPRWGLAAYGPQGAQKMLELMQAELKQAMMATGRPTLASINRSLVRMDFP